MTAHVKADPRYERALRRRLEARINEMIHLLDTIDDEPDIEEGCDDEPWLGWITTPTGIVHFGDVLDVELEDEHDEDDHDAEDDRADLEPSLGWTDAEAEKPIFHDSWHAGQDLEADSDYEPEEDIGVDDQPPDEERVL